MTIIFDLSHLVATVEVFAIIYGFASYVIQEIPEQVHVICQNLAVNIQG